DLVEEVVERGADDQSTLLELLRALGRILGLLTRLVLAEEALLLAQGFVPLDRRIDVDRPRFRAINQIHTLAARVRSQPRHVGGGGITAPAGHPVGAVAPGIVPLGPSIRGHEAQPDCQSERESPDASHDGSPREVGGSVVARTWYRW